MKKKTGSIDTYFSAASPVTQSALRHIYDIVRKVAPDAEETISYGMPAFRTTEILIYFAGFKNHVGIFPPIKADAGLREALARYRGPKGNLRFPIDEPIPFDLIERVVRVRADQLRTNATSRSEGSADDPL